MDKTLSKKYAAVLLLIFVLLCALSGCGVAEDPPATTGFGEETTQTAPSTDATQPTTFTPEATTNTFVSTTQCAHQYGPWTVVQTATCAHAGIQSRKCSLCADEQQEVLPAPEHSWNGGEAVQSNGQCGEGEIVYTCQSCGSVRSDALTASHSFGQWEYEAYSYTIYYEPDSLEYVHGGPSSTHESHRKVRTCTKCGFVEKGNTPDHTCKRGSIHHSVTVIRELTCTQPGIKRTTCNICGWYEDYEYGKADNGHAWISETRHLTDRTETTDYLDVEILTCTACGKVLYYYRGNSDHCICGQTPCIAGGDWRGCEDHCVSYRMYGKYRIAIDNRAYVFGQGDVFGDSYYVNTNDNQFCHNPDGYILHPTWQKVRRNYVFNENGEIVQFTVLWHDEEGNLFSDVVVVPDLPALFMAAGFNEDAFCYTEPCFHLTPNNGKLYPTSISGTM